MGFLIIIFSSLCSLCIFSVPGLTMSLPLFSHCPELVFVSYLLVIPGLFRFVLIISITVVPVTIKHFKMYIMLQPDIKNNLHQQFHHHSKVYKFQTLIVYIEFKNNSVFSNWEVCNWISWHVFLELNCNPAFFKV